MYDNYLAIGGVELVNAERTQAYVEHMLPQFDLQKIADRDLHVALEDESYRSPVIDNADWVSAREKASHQFYGLYPMSLEGFGDSTRKAEVSESVLNGGFVNSSRQASRPIRVHGLLIGANEAAVESGLSWLRAIVDSSDCSMHTSGSCGGNDMTFFLDKPVVCDPLYDLTTYTNFNVSNVASYLDSEAPFIYRIPADRDATQPGYMSLKPVADVRNEGLVASVGRMDLKSSTVLFESDQIPIYRKNLVVEPNAVASSTAPRWSVAATAGTPTITRATDADGAGYFEAKTSVAGVTRTNWAPDPGDELDPSMSWNTNATTSQVASNPNATSGRLVTFTAVGMDENTQLFASKSFLGPDVAQAGTVQFDVVYDSQLTVVIADNFGVEVLRDNPDLSAGFARLNYDVTFGSGYTLTLLTFDDTLVVGGLLFETGGSNASDYFDGSTPAGGGFTYSYVNGPASASQAASGGSADVTTAITLAKTLTGPLVGSLDIRSPGQTQVTLELLDIDHNEIIGSQVLDASSNWQRFDISAAFLTGPTIFRIRGTNVVDFRRVIIEHGEVAGLPYFDGATNPLTSAKVAWTGKPFASTATFTNYADPRLTFDTSDSQYRPFFRVASGVLQRLDFTSRYYPIIPVSEQLYPWRRTYHDVKATSGPTIIKKYKMWGGVAYEVEILFTAEKAYSFSDTVQFLSPTAAKTFANEIIVDGQPSEYNTAADEGYSPINTTGGATSSMSTVAFGANPKPQSDVGSSFTRLSVSTSTPSTSWSAGLDQFVGYNDQHPVPGQAPYPHSIMLDELYTASAWVRTNKAATVQLKLHWYSGTLATSTASVSKALAANTWTLVSMIGVKPDPVTEGASEFIVSASGVLGTGFTLDVAGSFFSNTLDPTYWGPASLDTEEFDYGTPTINGVQVPTRVRRDKLSAPSFVDPLLPKLPSPPVAPTIPNVAYVPQHSWRRYYVPIPASEVATWADTVPTVLINTLAKAERNIRVRFFPNPFGYDYTDLDPLSYCGEFIVSYMPVYGRLEVNGMVQKAFASYNGRQYDPADFILYGTDGGPMIWPTMSCEIPYMMTIDVDTDATLSEFQFGLNLNRRE